MKTQGKQVLVALAVLLAAGDVAAQGVPVISAGAAFGRRISEGTEAGWRQYAAESAAILLFRADANQDGLIDVGEFVGAETAGAEERFEIRDIDGDGFLSRDEIGTDDELPEGRRHALEVNIALYRYCMQAAMGEPPIHEDRFAEADLNDDGVLSLLEFSTYLEERAYVQFMRLDGNQDGVLTYAELIDGFEKQHRNRRLARACRELASDTTW